jgi:predicted helicase
MLRPLYRTKYADCLKRELPRIPYAPDFWAFSKAGKELAKWHLDYEEIEPYNLTFVESDDEPLSYRVEKMRLLGPDGKSARKVDSSAECGPKDVYSVRVNDSLTLAGIPAVVFDYRLGNRSALEWVIDQYKVSTDKRSGITQDPNRDDDEEYIVRLVGQVVRVSVETVRIVNG